MARSKIKPILWFLLNVEYPSTFIQQKKTDIHWWNPKMSIKKIVDGQWADVSEPMWNGEYVLVGSRRGWRYIEESLNVELLRRPSGGPYQMTVQELDAVREIEVVEKCTEPSFERGCKIKIGDTARSSYAGLSGVFNRSVSVRGGKFAKVVLNLYEERQIEAVIPIDYLRAL